MGRTAGDKTIDQALAADAEQIHPPASKHPGAGASCLRRCRSGSAGPTWWSKPNSKPDSSSTLTSSPRPDSPAASAIHRNSGVHAIALHGSAGHRRDSRLAAGIRANYPTAVGGGFGSKLDFGATLLAFAAWHCIARCAWSTRASESIMSTTKRHPARMQLRAGATRDGTAALDFAADFNTGAYSSWGPTVAARVPVHASGPTASPTIAR